MQETLLPHAVSKLDASQVHRNTLIGMESVTNLYVNYATSEWLAWAFYRN